MIITEKKGVGKGKKKFHHFICQEIVNVNLMGCLDPFTRVYEHTYVH